MIFDLRRFSYKCQFFKKNLLYLNNFSVEFKANESIAYPKLAFNKVKTYARSGL